LATQRGSVKKATIRLAKRILLNSFSHSVNFRNLTGLGYFGLNKIDRQIVKYLKQEPGFFVELGANDGLQQSNTLTLEKYHRWKGILIEPHPGNFNKLVKNRNPQNIFVNCACVDENFPKNTINLMYSDLMTIQTEGIQEIYDPIGHALAGQEFLRNEAVAVFSSPAKTLTGVLDSGDAPKRINLLSLDVEGAELGVLQGLDFEKYKFDVICVETRDETRVRSLLETNGYSLIEQISHHDYIFLEQSYLQNYLSRRQK
jgi:FkbM family methyltransferase